MSTPPHRISHNPYTASVTLPGYADDAPQFPRIPQVTFAIQSTHLLFRVAVGPISGGLRMSMKLPHHDPYVSFSCIVRREGDLMLMVHDAHGIGRAGEAEMVAVVALLAAAHCETTGGELWVVNGQGPQLISFCIGRNNITVSDPGSTTVYSTRGRGGRYTSEVAGAPQAGIIPANTRTISAYPAVSHPQLPLLREIIAQASVGELSLADAVVKWRRDPNATAVAPSEVTFSNVNAVRVTTSCICFTGGPIRGGGNEDNTIGNY